MKRRAFLSLLGLSPVAIPTVASALSAPKETRRWFQVWKPKALEVPKELVEFYEGVWRVMAQHCVPSESVDAWVHEKALDTVRAIYRKDPDRYPGLDELVATYARNSAPITVALRDPRDHDDETTVRRMADRTP